MIRLLRTLLVLVLLAAAVGAGWIMRDRWGSFLAGESGERAATEVVWEPVTSAGADRARERIGRLGIRGGPAYTAVGPGDLTAYIIQELSEQLPPSTENAEAAVIGDRLHVRGSVRVSDFGGERELGPLAGVVGAREEVEFSGTLTRVRSELAQYRVRSLRIRELNLPSPLIPRLVRNISRGTRPPDVADDALPLAIPSYIGDIRLAAGRIMIFGNTE
jgi:hypothetical protein